ncbi:MAG: DNA topoisomerase (ATP-hydrolyzing) subunit B [Candidatus Improbicoccus devescovinae]|nr:MAG: DNA topoisomerase (ATP-hydrolyzing) subunit B [Candidatus Improbicoccus devescovinae]
MKPKYDNESISSLKGEDRVRKRPAVIFGSDGIDGCIHCVFEILSNAIDEAREGYGNKIIVTKFCDNSIEIEDFGRGIPLDFNKNEQKYNWELLFLELYAGGKYNNHQDANYEYSLGMNGLGLCATQYASEYMNATVKRDGFLYNLKFEKGKNIGNLTKEIYNKTETGTKIKWKPDNEVFTEINIPNECLILMLKRQAVINSSVVFCLRFETEKNSYNEQKFYYKNGIVDYVDEIGGKDLICSSKFFKHEAMVQDHEEKPEYKLKIDAAMAFTTKNQIIEYYHNSSFLEHGGVPEKAVKNAFVFQFDFFLKKLGKYNKNESKINFMDIEENLILVVSSFSNVTSYENQTKKSISNKGILDEMIKFFKHNLEVFFLENPVDAEKIAMRILINKRSREDADRMKQNIKKKLSTNLDLSTRVAKFVDCRTKDLDIRELFIVEGDSALGACKQARDPNFQAIIPIRGKILNCLKADYAKILKNEIIIDLIKVLGCGAVIGKNDKKISNFNIKSLKWNKIILCTDADVDGFQIRTLLLTMIYKLAPDLMNLGKVFIAESPLYEINTKNQTYFAYNEAEKDEFLKKIKNEKFTIQRSKGLGENEPDMMSLTTMNPKTRRLIKILSQDIKQTAQIFDVLLGENLDGRKKYITKYGKFFLNELDVS